MKNLKTYTLLFVLLVCNTGFPSKAQSHAAIEQLKAYYKGLEDRSELNGNLLVAQNGKVLYAHSFGYANFEQRVLNTPNTGFNTASLGKTCTAIAVMQLVERHKITLDAAYARYFPDFPYKDVTIRQLLSHTSGMSDQELAPIFGAYKAKHPELILANNDLVPVLAEVNVQLKLRPGEKWWYSNIGFQLLGGLVEKQSGERMGDYLDKHLFKPAGMLYTYLRNRTYHPYLLQPYADNYDYAATFDTVRTKFDGTRSYYYNNDNMSGNGGIITTTADLLRYDEALYNGTFLTRASLNQLFTPSRLKNGSVNEIWLNIGNMGTADDGLGWFIFRDKSMGTIVWHTGGMPGCSAIFLRNLTKKQTVVMLDNVNSEKMYPKALNALRILNGKAPLTVPQSLTKLYGKALYAKGETYATSLLLRLKNDSLHYVLNENEMNNLGYAFLEHKHLSEALTTLKLNTRLYPQSDNVYNSYGEALLESGDKPGAIAMYRKSLAINPKNEDSLKALKALDQ
ncbi:serine hydrolase [Spirosoma sp. BT702]|uniref:Serine hydrolase n=1 Tax=Spirosoma profusum TaxID=2771354 RepID=A0A927AVJ8_9BACT|nr:serine hydrolase domain-containing protein [Spirosoma profusum]MBD2705191.1 serine hydrolase [Spirosoma profusum]